MPRAMRGRIPTTADHCWPRVAWTLKGEGCDWSGWDYLHCWIHVQTSRKTLPRVPAVLSIRQGASKSSPYMQVLSDLKKDEFAVATDLFYVELRWQ